MKAMRTKLDIFPEKEERCLGILSNTGYCFSQSGVGGWRIIVDSGCGLRIWLSPRRGNILWEGETSRSFGSRVELAWWVGKERIPKGKSSIPTRYLLSSEAVLGVAGSPRKAKQKLIILGVLGNKFCFLFFVFFCSSIRTFLALYFILVYSQLTMLWWFQVDSKGTQPYTYMYPFFPKLPSHPGCHITLGRVPCAIQRSLMVIHFTYNSGYMFIPTP